MRTGKKYRMYVLLTLVIIFMLTACGKREETEETFPEEAEEVTEEVSDEASEEQEEENLVEEEAQSEDTNEKVMDENNQTNIQPEELQPEKPQDHTPQPEVVEYDIASGAAVVQEQDGSYWLKGDYFYLLLPSTTNLEWEKVSSTVISIYHTPAKQAGYGGHLMTIEAFPKTDTSYMEYPSWALAGESSDKTYVVYYPTDVQFDPSDPAQGQEYMKYLEHFQSIEDLYQSADNPFAVKES